MSNGSLFLSWFFAGLLLIYLPDIFLREISWFSSIKFAEKHPEKEWLFISIRLIQIIWVTFSIIFTARTIQPTNTTIFYLSILFVPIFGIGIFKGLIELIFGVSSRLGFKKYERKTIFRFSWIHTNLDGLNKLEYRFALNKKIKSVGAFRVVINISFLTALLYFLL